MSEVVLPVSSSVDPYLRQVVPVLQRCKQAVREITQRDLKIFGKERGHLILFVTFEIIPDVQQSQRGRSRNPSGADIKTDAEGLNFIEQVKVYADKLKDLVIKLLVAEEEMKKKDSTLSRKINKLTKLKKSLDEFTRLLDTIVAFYSFKFLGFHPTVDLPKVEDVKKLKEQLGHLKSKLKQDELVSLFASYDAEFNTSNEVIMCTILGLSEDYGHWLQELDTEMFMHEPIMYYLQKSIEDKENELEAEGILRQSGKQMLAENLQSLGFNKETAEVITKHIPDEFVDLQKPSYWATRYLDHAFQHHPLLSNKPRKPRYLQHEQLLDEWFEVKLPLDYVGETRGCADAKLSLNETRGSEDAKPGLDEAIGSEDAKSGLNETRVSEDAKLGLNEAIGSEDAKLCAVRMINISSDASQGNVLVEEFLQELNNDENCLLFHGTTHESAMSVVANGIIVNEGCKKQDFSSGDGFYLSNKFDNAKSWSRAGRGEHQAVIVYNVNRSLLDLNESDGLDLSQNTTLWEEVVRCCRNGYRNKKSRKVFGKYAFIQGPPCKNPGDINGRNPLLPYKEAGMQICIRDDSFAEEFGSLNNVACVIFY